MLIKTTDFRALGAALAIGGMAGALFAWVRMPLPWLIGPLLAVAVASVLGARLHVPRPVRNAGQWIIGIALGLYFTQDVILRLASIWWAILLAVAYAFALGGFFAWTLRRFARLDPPTAFFGGAVGSATEMLSLCERAGGATEAAATAHSLRVLMVVFALPIAYQLLDLSGSDAYVPGRLDVNPAGLLGLLALTWLVGSGMSRFAMPNAWMIGPMLVAGLLTVSGHSPTAMPAWLSAMGQVAIGVALGRQFQPGFFGRAPRLAAVVFVMTLLGIVVSAGFGAMLAMLLGMPVATLVLATSPGGIAEMSLTAKVLRLGVPVVSVFHVMRMVAMVLGAGPIYRLLARRRGWPEGLPSER